MIRKTVVITGGTTGIGFATAKYLTEHHYNVIITGRTEHTLNDALHKLGHHAKGYISDTSSLTAISELVHLIKQDVKQIDGLFINAGIFIAASFEETSETIFNQTMDINFKGAFYTIQQFVPLLKNPSSVVLNTSVAVFKAFENTSVYTASKAALEAIAKVLNIELAAKGIRLNTISPGVTQTPIQKKSGMTDEAILGLMDHLQQTSPIGRVLQPEDIAPSVEFLLSDKSFALRNERIIIDGGTTL